MRCPLPRRYDQCWGLEDVLSWPLLVRTPLFIPYRSYVYIEKCAFCCNMAISTRCVIRQLKAKFRRRSSRANMTCCMTGRDGIWQYHLIAVDYRQIATKNSSHVGEKCKNVHPSSFFCFLHKASKNYRKFENVQTFARRLIITLLRDGCVIPMIIHSLKIDTRISRVTVSYCPLQEVLQ